MKIEEGYDTSDDAYQSELIDRDNEDRQIVVLIARL